ncbi:MAG: hypothetical protein KIS78_25080 [Labilithrix sp.]|nr:hypothetical protein [Labilithrix sp.]
MAFDAIAYGPDEPCLVTIDGAELLAHDARSERPKWSLAFEQPLVAALFVDPRALPACAGGSGGGPWRSAASTGRSVLALDVEGRLHLVDPTGHALGTYGPFGKPRAIAASATGASLALAVDDAVLLWRGGERLDVPLRASVTATTSALAFSRDGATLAAATEKGEVRTFDVGGALEETLRVDLRGAIAALAEDEAGRWLVAGRDGASSVGPAGAVRLDKLPGGVKRACFDAAGGRLALQRSERSLVVYEWPSLSVAMRIEYTDRSVRGLSFGADDWLGVALDRGDGNKIDVVTSATRRTDTHPGRPHRSWTLLVEGRAERRSAKEAQEIARPKAAFPAPPKSRGNAVGARVGIGAMISIAVLAVRVCVRTSTPGKSFTYQPSVVGSPALDKSTCDRACAEDRLSMLARECERPTLRCAVDARAAVQALAAGDCEEAKAAVERIDSVRGGRGGGADAPLFGANLLLARLGLDEACAGGALQPLKKHVQLVTLSGPELEPLVERIPDATLGETPRAVWAAPDGAIFVATRVAGDRRREDACVVYRKSEAGAWATVNEGLAGDCAALYGASSTEVYLATSYRVTRFDGEAWERVPTPSLDLVQSSTSSGADLFVASLHDEVGQVHRRRGDTWASEPIPAGVEVTSLFGGGSTLWALGQDAASRQVLLHRSARGAWSVRTPAGDAGAESILDVWTSPTGDTFVATDARVLRSTRGGPWKELEAPGVVTALWGRSSADVYGASLTGLLHYDGKAWSETSYVGRVGAVSGAESRVLIARVGD